MRVIAFTRICVLAAATAATVSAHADASRRHDERVSHPSNASFAHVTDVDGRVVDPFDRSSVVKATVLLFTVVDCPMANRYAPEVRRLHGRFASSGVQFLLVYANPHDERTAIREHLKRFAYPMRAVIDRQHELVTFAKATVASEAALVTPAGRMIYRGRIDDRFVSFGVERPRATRRDLEAALAAFLDGRSVSAPVTRAVGCYLADFGW